VEQREQISLTIAKIIREKSETGQLVQLEEILKKVAEHGLPKSETSGHGANLEAILTEVVKENEDLKEVSGKNGVPHYYSSLSLSDTYAGILIRKEENSLIAEIVRENSKIYPRPVPIDIFRESPFDLAQHEILESMRRMGQDPEYQDIAQTITSIGTIFLFSSRHLDPVYASTLAEWVDVGQVNNP
jgi:hypothetical protein